MNTKRLKPQKKIDELLLLETILKYTRENQVGPTAEALMELKSQFAPSLTKTDTLRMWLNRHTGRTIRKLGDRRPHRYELNNQGEKKIPYLQERTRRLEDFKKQLDQQYQIYMNKQVLFAREQVLFARDIQKSVNENKLLLELITVLCLLPCTDYFKKALWVALMIYKGAKI